jgi:hypothetical protein
MYEITRFFELPYVGTVYSCQGPQASKKTSLVANITLISGMRSGMASYRLLAMCFFFYVFWREAAGCVATGSISI